MISKMITAMTSRLRRIILGKALRRITIFDFVLLFVVL